MCAFHSHGVDALKPVLLGLASGEKIIGIKSKCCCAASVSEQMQFVAQDTAGQIRRGAVTDDILPAVLRFLRDLALKRPMSTRAGDATQEPSVTDQEPAVLPVDEDITLAELMQLTCKTHKHDVPKQSCKELPVFKRSGGFLVACASSGLILDLAEFLGAESVTQRYFFLARLLVTFPEISVVVHDDACHVRRYADSRSHLSEACKRLAFPKVIYAIDKFHARGHVDEWCLQNCHPRCEAVKAAIEDVAATKSCCFCKRLLVEPWPRTGG
jgi:hypothetical protein